MKGGKKMKWANILAGMVMGKKDKTSGNGIERLQIRRAGDGLDLSMKWLAERKTPENGRQYYSEKRRFNRYNDGQEVLCYPMTSFPVQAQVLDASLGGLRIKAKEMMELNTDVGVVLQFKGESAHFIVKVLWQAKREGDYEYGLEFSRADQGKNRQVLQYIANLK
jgi:hypothetical protein